MGLRAVQHADQVSSTEFIKSIEQKVATLLNAIYCEEDIYMHPYRKSLSLKEWKITYMKSKVDFSNDIKISAAQFRTLREYSKRLNLCKFFERIDFKHNMDDNEYLYVNNSEQLDALLEFLRHVHTAAK